MYPDTQTLPRYDAATSLLMLSTPGSPHEKALDPRTVRKNDTSAKSMHEWMGVLTVDIEEAPSMSIPAAVSPLGNYAAQIQWEDGFNQVGHHQIQGSSWRSARCMLSPEVRSHSSCCMSWVRTADRGLQQQLPGLWLR